MEAELAKFGVTCRGSEDGIEIDGIKYTDLKKPQGGVHCYDDHRVAMSFSVLALLAPHGTLIRERECVGKTWPGWWDTLRQTFEVQMEGVDLSSPFQVDSKTSEDMQKSVFLVGMRGAGKTTTGKWVADLLERQFFDLDALLEAELERTIPKIIQESGLFFEYFFSICQHCWGAGHVSAAFALLYSPRMRFNPLLIVKKELR